MQDDIVWIDESGRRTCGEHGGAYLAASIRARPDATFHLTPLGDWSRADGEDFEYWARMRAESPEIGALECETCADERNGR